MIGEHSAIQPARYTEMLMAGERLRVAAKAGYSEYSHVHVMEPLAIDLFCGLGGWTEGLLAEGYYVVGFDNVRHVYGEHRYPGQLVVQDVLTLHGSQFKDATLIVGSSPCQEFSYRAMPWKRAKALGPPELGIALFNAQFRIQREASEAAGRHIPMVVENVRGAIPWVGRSRWNYGSFHLWGDVPALMPIRPGYRAQAFNDTAVKVVAHLNQRNGCGHTRHLTNPAEHEGVKNGNDWFGAGDDCSLQRRSGSKSTGRKFASAMIAKIPLPLSQYIARCFKGNN